MQQVSRLYHGFAAKHLLGAGVSLCQQKAETIVFAATL
jgi:hypothetical protein